jgi:hypothetical protein
MQIGSSYKVLFCAYAEGIDQNGDPVLINARHPRYWGTNVMFQMISNRCASFCHGTKIVSDTEPQLARIENIRLSSVAKEALKGINYHTKLQDNILNGMRALKVQMMDKNVGEYYHVAFDINGKLQLRLHHTTGNSILFPPTEVAEEILQGN